GAKAFREVAMSLRELLNTRYGVTTALAIAQGTPRRLAHKIVEWAAVFFARRRRTDLVKAVHLNQWVVSGKTLNAVELHRATIEVFRNTGRSFYDFYHNLDRPKEVLRLVRLTPEFDKVLRERERAKDGTMIVVPHLSNFDLAGRALALLGFRFQVLSYPVTPGGYKLQNKLRSEAGLEVTPMNIDAMRRAKKRLQDGGLVLTGMDRPMEESNYPVRFFGQLANLPVTYIRLALQAHCPVLPVVCQRAPDGYYYMHAAEPVEMQEYKDQQETTVLNAERVVSLVEKFIRQTPRQWAMFYPVWPQFFPEVPRWGERQASPVVSEKA
ncbi:MAG TPA: lysophospholipid acyltransferase family protein, partial [Anaerolineaceae bacterium]|nr:lysophospholipid acyltransferase family protein [Anaerolineaceae bacterium]